MENKKPMTKNDNIKHYKETGKFLFGKFHNVFGDEFFGWSSERHKFNYYSLKNRRVVCWLDDSRGIDTNVLRDSAYVPESIDVNSEII